MKLKIIIGIITILLIGSALIVTGITYTSRANKKILKQVEEAIKTDTVQENKHSSIDSNVTEVDGELLQCEYIWFNDLLEVISLDELDKLKEKLDLLFGIYLKELQRIDDVNSYYTVHTQEIKNKIGSTTLTDFTTFYEKIRSISDYNQCVLALQYETFHTNGDMYVFDIVVTFDQTVEMEYTMSINKLTFEIELR